jgi:hypothetical protein
MGNPRLLQEWNTAAEEAITRASFGEHVTWEHMNHASLVKILQVSKAVPGSLRLSGRAIVEDINFSHILIGRISVTGLADVMNRHGDGRRPAGRSNPCFFTASKEG